MSSTSWVNDFVEQTEATKLPPHVERCWVEPESFHLRRGGGGNVVGLAGLTVTGNQAPRMWRGAGSSQGPPIMGRGDIVGLTGLKVTGLPNLTREVIIHRAELNHGGRGSRRRLFTLSL